MKIPAGEVLKALNEALDSSLQTNQAMGKKLKQQADLLDDCAAAVKSQAIADWGQQKLLAGSKPCEPDSFAIRLYERLKEAGYEVR